MTNYHARPLKILDEMIEETRGIAYVAGFGLLRLKEARRRIEEDGVQLEHDIWLDWEELGVQPT